MNLPFYKKKEKFQGIFNYKLKHFFGKEGPKYTFRPKYDQDGITEGKRISGASPKLITPGPGQYNIKDSKSTREFTFGEKIQKIKNKETIPGVGTYNLNNFDDWKVPCFSFGKEQRKNLLLNEEGLKYNKGISKLRLDLDNINTTKTPKWSFYNIERFSQKPKSAQIEKQKYPGPGAYPLKTYIGEGPKYSFHKDKNNHSDPEDEYISKKNRNFPGPNTYYKDLHYNPSGPIFTISKLNRKDIENDKYISSLPGPNTYNPNKTRTSGWTIFPMWTLYKTDSKNKKDKSTTLGPGKYEYKTEIGLGPKYTIGKRLKKLKKYKIPGPGTYNIKTDIINSPRYSIGLKLNEEERKNPKYKEKNIKRSILNIPSDIVNNKGFSFPKAKRNKNKNRIIYPGPGDYKIPTSFDYISNVTREKGFFDPKFRYV